ncbi:hypothetical protein BDM02DRAFT_3110080, partial [Thelephora ganbajun]
MASRRLAISSLLCSDETNPPSSSPTSSPTSARTSTARDFEPVDRSSRHHPAFSARTSSVHTQTTPSYRPLSDVKYTSTVDRSRPYNDSDALRSRSTTYSPQLAYRREPSTSPERVSTQHQHQRIYTVIRPSFYVELSRQLLPPYSIPRRVEVEVFLQLVEAPYPVSVPVNSNVPAVQFEPCLAPTILITRQWTGSASSSRKPRAATL